MVQFSEERFPEDISYGSSGGPGFSTDIVVTQGGFEQRNINWQVAREWVGTRFKHQGRMKHSAGQQGGCDCIGLILGVVKECEENGTPLLQEKATLERASKVSYGKLPKGGLLEEQLAHYLDEIPK
jgi:hypothetical protein